MFGFTSADADPPQPLCFLCGEVLSNQRMKPTHLQQLSNNQPSVGKTAEKSERVQERLKSNSSCKPDANKVPTCIIPGSNASC